MTKKDQTPSRGGSEEGLVKDQGFYGFFLLPSLIQIKKKNFETIWDISYSKYTRFFAFLTS